MDDIKIDYPNNNENLEVATAVLKFCRDIKMPIGHHVIKFDVLIMDHTITTAMPDIIKAVYD